MGRRRRERRTLAIALCLTATGCGAAPSTTSGAGGKAEAFSASGTCAVVQCGEVRCETATHTCGALQGDLALSCVPNPGQTGSVPTVPGERCSPGLWRACTLPDESTGRTKCLASGHWGPCSPEQPAWSFYYCGLNGWRSDGPSGSGECTPIGEGAPKDMRCVDEH